MVISGEPPRTEQERNDNGKQVEQMEQVEEGKKPVDSEEDVLHNILNIFPDVSLTYITKLYRDNRFLQGSNITEFLADKLAETDYPKSEFLLKAGRKRKRVEEDENEGKSPDYEANDRPPVNGERYELVRSVLKQEFPLMPVQYITTVMTQNRNYLAKTYSALVKADKSYNPKTNLPFRQLLNPRKGRDQSHRLKKGKDWTEISAELEYARGVLRREQMQAQMEADAKLAAQINEKEHQDSNMLMECKCCFGEYPFNSMTHCNDLHFFCLDCARRNAEAEVGNGRYKLSCMDGSGCKALFPRDQMLRFLNDKTLSALSKIEQQDALRIAEIDGLVKCPFCDYGAICAPAEVDKEFDCQNPDCMEISCRLCNQKSHIPLTCKEYAKESKINVRHRVEEAMTEALVRKCNKCSYPYIKEYGCNKIHCNRCNTLQCYICSQTIKNYDHFNDPARGGKIGNCPLFDNTEERHHDEVENAAKKAKEMLREEHPELGEEDLRIELSERVRKEEEAKRSRAAPPNGGGIPPYQPQAPRPPVAPPQAGRRRAPPPALHVGGAVMAVGPRGRIMQRVRDRIQQVVQPQAPPAQPAPMDHHLPLFHQVAQNMYPIPPGPPPQYAPYPAPDQYPGAKPAQQPPIGGPPAAHGAPVVNEHIPPPPPQPPPSPYRRPVLSRRNTVAAARPLSAEIQRRMNLAIHEGDLRMAMGQAPAPPPTPPAGSPSGISSPQRRR
ncbi:hypothetical protein L873DRAFT_1824716 [Choiromyces venosus 120613-1]|uniref:RING-type domain-containing protein n=1 Tax=Choiromyces venosus 120613-1 TaxID=1336337 RepID=A0A3N4K5Z4_9PEZI|nr:hypothetical protein L873DRAFT_1824716 [Choiromyces venosus 120613-1]